MKTVIHSTKKAHEIQVSESKQEISQSVAFADSSFFWTPWKEALEQ